MIRCTAAAIAATSVLLAGTAQAQSLRNARPTSCTDAAGVRVVSVSTRSLGNVGMAGRVRGKPVMLFNPVIMRRFQPITRTFWFYHECAHHALGHSLGFRPMTRERDADCWAIRQMRRRGLLGSSGLRTIQSDLRSLNGDGVLYLPGPRRASYVAACARGEIRPQRIARRYASAPSAARRFRDEGPVRYRNERMAGRYHRDDRVEGPIVPRDHRSGRNSPGGSGYSPR